MLALILASVLLAGDRVEFDQQFHPHFNEHQMRASAMATRGGLEKWAATAEGKAILERMRGDDIEVDVVERRDEPSLGRAPQPGMATMLTANDHTRVKRYQLILNPGMALLYGRDGLIHLGEPATPEEAMAAAWAGEMLHIEFYSRGIQLPHHERADFQERWHAVADQLGFPLMTHDTEHRSRGDRGTQ